MAYPDQTPAPAPADMANDHDSEHALRPDIVVPKIIISQPRVQWLPDPGSRKGGRILVDLEALQASQPPNSNLDFTKHPRYSSYYASSNPPSYRERHSGLHPSQSHRPKEIMAQPQQRIPPGGAPTGPRQQFRSHPNHHFTDMNSVNFGVPQAPPTAQRASGSRRNTATSQSNTTCKESKGSQMYATTVQLTSSPMEEDPTLCELADEALKFTDPAKYRRKIIASQRLAPHTFLPSVLDPKITVTEISYDDAIAAITKETGPLLMNLKNIPSRPVDLVLYDPKGSSLAVFTLLLTRDVDLVWLISWIQIFVDKWVKNEHHPDILVVRSVKIRMTSKVQTESYPPLQGTPVDRTQRDTTGPFKGFYFMKWDCHDSQMEKYWEVFRCMLQMGAGASQKPIFKVYTVSIPLATAPINLRDQKSLAPSQYFENGKSGFPLLSEAFFLECNDKMGYARMTSSSEAAFVARELQIADDIKTTQMSRAAQAKLPSESNAPFKVADSHGLRESDAKMKPLYFASDNAESPHAFPRNMIISLPLKYKGSAEEKSYIKHPQDKWVTISVNGESQRVFAPYRKPVSEDPTRVWSYYQKWGGGNPELQAAFNFDDIPFEVDQFPSYKIVNGTAVNLNVDGDVDSEGVTVTGESSGKTTDDCGYRETIGSSATLAGEQEQHGSSIYDQKTAIGQERLFRYQKEFEAAKGFDSEDDDIYFPKRGQPPSPSKEAFKSKDRWFERNKTSSGPRPAQFSDQRNKEVHGLQPQQFPGFAATARSDDRSIALAHNNAIRNSFESPFQTFPQWNNPPLIHDLSATENFMPATSMASLTVMNPGAPSFQVYDQSDTSLRLNVNAPAFQQSTVSVPPHRIIPVGYGNMTPISTTSPAVSRIPSQVSLTDQKFQNGPSVDGLVSNISNLHMSTGNLNAISHNFDHFSRLSQGGGPAKNNTNASWSNTNNYRAQSPALGNSFRSVAYGPVNNGSNYQHSQAQNQPRNPHIPSLNQRLQAHGQAHGQVQGQVRERPDRSRTFDRDRQQADNRGHGTGLSGVPGTQNFYYQGSGSGGQYQSMSAFGAGRGNLEQDLAKTNPMVTFYGSQQNPDATNQPSSSAFSEKITAFDLEQQAQSGVPRARSFSPKKSIRHGFSVRASGNSDHTTQRKDPTKEKEEEVLRGIVDNFQTQGENDESN